MNDLVDCIGSLQTYALDESNVDEYTNAAS
jgi:hypothetical protein